jgi:hypothetical protein
MEGTLQGQQFNLCAKRTSPPKLTTLSTPKNQKVLNSRTFPLNYATSGCKVDE